MSANQAQNSQETKYVKRGLLFGVIVLLFAGNTFYDDVYSDGVSTTLKSKINRIIGKKKMRQATEEKATLDSSTDSDLKKEEKKSPH